MTLKTLTLPVLRSLGIVGSLTLLMPGALSAMQQQQKNKDKALYVNVSASYWAEIVDANKNQLPQTKPLDGSDGFGPYTVKATWTPNDVAKIATVACLIKKNGATVANYSTPVPYESTIYKLLDAEGNQLKLWYTKKLN